MNPISASLSRVKGRGRWLQFPRLPGLPPKREVGRAQPRRKTKLAFNPGPVLDCDG
jgi:hypothetical protein